MENSNPVPSPEALEGLQREFSPEPDLSKSPLFLQGFRCGFREAADWLYHAAKSGAGQVMTLSQAMQNLRVRGEAGPSPDPSPTPAWDVMVWNEALEAALEAVQKKLRHGPMTLGSTQELLFEIRRLRK